MLGLLTKNKKKKEDTNEPSLTEEKVQKLKKKIGKHSNLYGIWIFLSLNIGVTSILSLLVFVNLIQTGRVANKPPATLVEDREGRGILVSPVGSTQRTPKAIKKFTADILGALFTVSPMLKSSDGLQEQETFDPGIKIEKGNSQGPDRVTQNAYMAAIGGMAPGFRDEFLKKLTELYPPGTFNGTSQAFFRISYMGEPIRLDGKSDEWTVTVVGMRYTINTNISGNGFSAPSPSPFRQVIYLKSVSPQVNPLPNIATEIQNSIFDITSIGLQITKMVPLEASAAQGSDFLHTPQVPQAVQPQEANQEDKE